MSAPKNSCFLKALRHEATPYTPIWIMRQAGRYLPEYRKTRERAGSFMGLCKNPELASEVTLQPLRRFALDAAIVFSDILTIPDAIGLGLSFVEGEGPKLAKPIQSLKQIENLPTFVAEESLSYVMDAVRLIKAELNGTLPLIGFAGSPFTLAAYMLEGESSRDFRKVKTFLYSHPQAMHQLLAYLADAVAGYLLDQIKAGADVVMIFDSWGGILAPKTYRAFSQFYIQSIVTKLKAAHPQVPVIVYTRGNQEWQDLAAIGANCLGLDFTVSLQSARQALGDMILQGNLDPAVLYAPQEVIRREAERVLKEAGARGHIFNLGQGILPDVNPDALAILIDAVHEFRHES